MNATTRPLFALYVIWRPSCRGGPDIAESLRRHFGRDLYQAVAEGRGVSVVYRSEPVPGSRTPPPLDWNDAQETAVVALSDATLVDDPDWVAYVRDIARAAEGRGLPARFFPVAMDGRGLAGLEMEQQALRWDDWAGSDGERVARLTRDLTHEFCRMLRHRLEPPQPGGGAEKAFGGYLEKVRVFISHTKHDGDGETVARRIRDWIHEYSPLGSFFDVTDIPPGLPFADVLLERIGSGAVLAVHTDSYSSREWCRREVIEAKRRAVPMVVVDCVRHEDPRSMPYLGNVPVVRMEPGQADRIGAVAGRLLDEVFRRWLWQCRVAPYVADAPEVLFTARPPELTDLAALPVGGDGPADTIVYPERRLSADEERLFSAIAPTIRLQTLRQWLEERP